MQLENLILQLMAVAAVAWSTAAMVREYQRYGWLWPLYRLGAVGVAMNRWAIILTRWAVTTKYAMGAWWCLLRADKAKENRAGYDAMGRYYVAWHEVAVALEGGTKNRNRKQEPETEEETSNAAT